MRENIYTRASARTQDSNVTRVVFDLLGVSPQSWLTRDVTPRLDPFGSIIVRRVSLLRQWYLKMGH